MDLLTKAAMFVYSLAVAALGPAGSAPSGSAGALELNKPIPAFAMTAVDGKKITNETLSGKAYLIDFWATWCGPCKKASPMLQALHAQYGKQGLVVIGANGLEDVEGPKPAKDYATTHKYSYTFTYGNDQLMKDWEIVGVPTFVLVDKAGKVKKVITGFDAKREAELKLAVADVMK